MFQDAVWFRLFECRLGCLWNVENIIPFNRYRANGIIRIGETVSERLCNGSPAAFNKQKNLIPNEEIQIFLYLS